MRNVGLAALKTLSCFSAVTFYSSSRMCTESCFLHEEALSILYFLSIIASPLFFMIIGYIDEVNQITKQEVFGKLKAIFVIVVFWNILFYFLDEAAFRQGYFLQSWLLLSVAIIYIINPLFSKLVKNHKAAIWVISVFISVSFFIDIVSLMKGRPYLIDFPSYFRIWTWFFYYLVGRFLGTELCQEVMRRATIKRIAWYLLIPLAISMYFYDSFISSKIYRAINAGYFLDNLHVLAVSLCLFALFENLRVKGKIFSRIFEYVAPTMIGVYILHDGVFYYISTLFDFNTFRFPMTMLILVFIVSVLFSRTLMLNRFMSRFISF